MAAHPIELVPISSPSRYFVTLAVLVILYVPIEKPSATVGLGQAALELRLHQENGILSPPKGECSTKFKYNRWEIGELWVLPRKRLSLTVNKLRHKMRAGYGPSSLFFGVDQRWPVRFSVTLL